LIFVSTIHSSQHHVPNGGLTDLVWIGDLSFTSWMTLISSFGGLQVLRATIRSSGGKNMDTWEFETLSANARKYGVSPGLLDRDPTLHRP